MQSGQCRTSVSGGGGADVSQVSSAVVVVSRRRHFLCSFQCQCVERFFSAVGRGVSQSAQAAQKSVGQG